MAELIPVEPFDIVIFGGTGDLATRKLFPALFGLWHRGYLPEKFLIAGVSNLDYTDDSFRELVTKSVEHYPEAAPDDPGRFAKNVFYQKADFGSPDEMKALDRRIEELEKGRGLPGNRLFYFAVAPSFFATLAQGVVE